MGEIRFDCDNDCLLIKIEQRGAACHTGQRSCFYRQWDGEVKNVAERLVDAAIAGRGGRQEVIYEIADLFFHVLVLLGYYELPPERIFAELRRRFGLSGIDEKESAASNGSFLCPVGSGKGSSFCAAALFLDKNG